MEEKRWLLLAFLMAIAGSTEEEHRISQGGHGHLLLRKDRAFSVGQPQHKEEDDDEEEEEEESVGVFVESFSSSFSSSMAVAGDSLRPLSFSGGGEGEEEQSMDPLWEEQQQEEKSRDDALLEGEDEILVLKIHSHRECRKRTRQTLRELAMASDDESKEKGPSNVMAGLKKAKRKGMRFKAMRQQRVFDCEVKIAFSRFIPKTRTKVVVHRIYTTIKDCFHLSKVEA